MQIDWMLGDRAITAEHDFDGLRLDPRDGSWVQVRMSDTEENGRVYSDATTQERPDELRDIGKVCLEQAMQEVG